MKIKKGDTVQVISGKDLGRKGKVIRALPKANKVVVEGINRVKRHQKPSRTVPQGGIINIEAPLNASNVMLVCSKCNEPTRVGMALLETGKARKCKKCGEIID